jgi:hypothetical protein
MTHGTHAPGCTEQAPIQITTEQAREYLIGFMEQHFTDKTFHRYIRADPVDARRLAGDFAWQMATALRHLTAPAPAPIQSAELAELRKLAENAANAKSALDPSWHQFQDAMDAILPATILRLLDALAAVPAAQQQAQSVPAGWREAFDQARESICAGGLAEYAQHERSIVTPHLDALYDELDALESAAPTPPAATPARELTDAEILDLAWQNQIGWESCTNFTEFKAGEEEAKPYLAFARAIARHLAAPQGERETEQKQGEL